MAFAIIIASCGSSETPAPVVVNKPIKEVFLKKFGRNSILVQLVII
jgi:hypothetical protein